MGLAAARACIEGALGTDSRRQCYVDMDTIALLLLAVNVLLAIVLFDAELQDEPRRRLERVEARRRALRAKDDDRPR